MGFVDKWPYECKGNDFSKAEKVGIRFQASPENLEFFLGVALAHIYVSQKARKGWFNAPPTPRPLP